MTRPILGLLSALSALGLACSTDSSSTTAASNDQGPPGRTATCEELVGAWKMIPTEKPEANEVDPWPLPYQWFSFYEDGRVSWMMTNEDADLTGPELREILAPLPRSATYRCVGQWLIIEYRELPGRQEVWGKNIFTRRAGLNNRIPFEVGDIAMGLAGPPDGRPIYFRRLRRLRGAPE